MLDTMILVVGALLILAISTVYSRKIYKVCQQDTQDKLKTLQGIEIILKKLEETGIVAVPEEWIREQESQEKGEVIQK